MRLMYGRMSLFSDTDKELQKEEDNRKQTRREEGWKCLIKHSIPPGGLSLTCTQRQSKRMPRLNNWFQISVTKLFHPVKPESSLVAVDSERAARCCSRKAEPYYTCAMYGTVCMHNTKYKSDFDIYNFECPVIGGSMVWSPTPHWCQNAVSFDTF